MQRRTFILASVSMIALIGCEGGGSRSVTPSPKVGPHGGALVTLPNDLGFAEVVSEATASTSKTGATSIAAYFLDKEQTAAITPLPSEARVLLLTPDKPEPLELVLKPEPNKDKFAAGRLATAPGPYQFDPLVGKLEVTIGGQSVSAEFSNSR